MRHPLHRPPCASKDAGAIGSVDPLRLGSAALAGGRAEEFAVPISER